MYMHADVLYSQAEAKKAYYLELRRTGKREEPAPKAATKPAAAEANTDEPEASEEPAAPAKAAGELGEWTCISTPVH